MWLVLFAGGLQRQSSLGFAAAVGFALGAEVDDVAHVPVGVAFEIEVDLACAVKFGFVAVSVDMPGQFQKQIIVHSLLHDVFVRPSCGICLRKDPRRIRNKLF